MSVILAYAVMSENSDAPTSRQAHLREAGIPDREAAWAIDLLLLYATAVTTECCNWQTSQEARARARTPQGGGFLARSP